MENSKLKQNTSNILDSKLQYDSVEQVREKISTLRKGEKSQKMKDINFRVDQLKRLRAALIKYENEIHISNQRDLGLSEFMSFYGSFAVVKKDVDEVIENIYEWAEKRQVNSPALLAPASSYVIPEPFGVCLIMSAWNSQYQTLIMPLAQALAAGNVILAKPSEMAESSAILCNKIFEELDPEVVQVCQGGAEVCIELLKNKFDIIVFTGSPQKGVLVAKAAAEFLTPCILELGGQNPVIVDRSANLQNASYNLLNGRFLLSGQVCIAPEYVMVEEEIFESLLKELKNTLKTFYGEDPKKSGDYSRIINDFHTERLAKLVQNPGGKIISGGEYDLKEKYIAPTLVSFDSLSSMAKSPLACSEIFGPILYLAPYKKIDDCIEYINSKDKPLTLYYFGTDQVNKKLLMNKTSSGAFVTNDCIMHFTNSDLPFGGVGNSGYSAYHGKWGFDNLSHLKPVLERKQMLMKFRYPPFTSGKQKTLKFLIENLKLTQWKLVKIIAISALLVAVYLNKNFFAGVIKHGFSKF
jgi:aldehyde dehydrogenase (NAD+)